MNDWCFMGLSRRVVAHGAYESQVHGLEGLCRLLEWRAGVHFMTWLCSDAMLKQEDLLRMFHYVLEVDLICYLRYYSKYQTLQVPLKHVRRS